MGETITITITREEYEDLVDARNHAVAMREIAEGGTVIPGSEIRDYLAAPSPLAFFRKRAGLTQSELAQRARVSQPYLAQLEQGRRKGGLDIYLRLARLLGVRVEDLADEDED